jgi:Glycosyl transferase family 2
VTYPKLTMTLLVRNEADILADNIRYHHDMGVDSFIVMDNLSTDATPEIIRALSQQFDIDYLRQEDDDYNQWQWVTDMARRAARDHGADWVINNDADEFWQPEAGDLKQFCAALPPAVSVVEVQRHNAVVSCDSDAPLAGACHPRSSVMFERQSLNVKGQPLPGKVLHRASETVTVAQGNHSVRDLSGQSQPAGERLRILHYPYRTLAHYKDKIRLGGAAYARNTTLDQGIGATWRSHYAALETGALDRFWLELAQTPEEIAIGLYSNQLFRDSRVSDFLTRIAAQSQPPAPLAAARAHLLERSQALVSDFTRSQAQLIKQAGRDLRWNRPMYHNLRFAVSSAEAHLQQLQALTAESDPQKLCGQLPALRDVFSLFPRNGFLPQFLGTLLESAFGPSVARLRADCAGKRVILHTSCHPRLADTAETIASFQPLEGDFTHVILVGEAQQVRSEAEMPLGFDYDGKILRVPAPDNYESLHRKLFYAYMLFDLLAPPELLIKIDDNILLQKPADFAACIDRVAAAGAACAGRQVGSTHHASQWHGWHIGKCADPLIEARGYQYPLPRVYAAGGHGYVLSPKGLGACAYMYLAMKEFFAMRSVGLEDACVGHALYAQSLDLLDLSTLDNQLTLPGLTTKERHRREVAWRDIMGEAVPPQ